MPFFRLRSALSSSHRTGRRRKKDSLPATMTFKDFTRVDDDIVSCAEATDDEILRQVVPEPESGSDDDNDDRPQPSAAEIANAFVDSDRETGGDEALAVEVAEESPVLRLLRVFIELLAQRDQNALRKQAVSSCASTNTNAPVHYTNSITGSVPWQATGYYQPPQDTVTIQCSNTNVQGNNSFPPVSSGMRPVVAQAICSPAPLPLQTSTGTNYQCANYSCCPTKPTATPSSSGRSRGQKKLPRTRMPKLSAIISSRAVCPNVDVGQMVAAAGHSTANACHGVRQPNCSTHDATSPASTPNAMAGPRIGQCNTVHVDSTGQLTTCRTASKEISMQVPQVGGLSVLNGALSIPSQCSTAMTSAPFIFTSAPSGGMMNQGRSTIMVQQVYSQKVASYSPNEAAKGSQMLQHMSSVVLPPGAGGLSAQPMISGIVANHSLQRAFHISAGPRDFGPNTSYSQSLFTSAAEVY
ncbi:hypothetical protein HPB51_011740 [Rhipicephalus microplus]|uniref:Uncharacterized protein n=1 Tax=Rhipicephalus microplus TaxID=6941 RepID=A0A9J6DMP4_RHIMP|nr:hypothetical protein HPB51_011740 [Rhipicephalus microplus]